MQETLESLQIDYVWEQLANLVRNPYSNITAALLLLGVVVVTVLLISVFVIALVTRPTRRRDRLSQREIRYYLSVLAADQADTGEQPAGAHLAARGPLLRTRDYPWAGTLLVVMAAMLLVAVAVGASSASSAVCLACHELNPHSEVVAAGGSDPHAAVGCTRCHESSGWLGAVTIEVPERVAHLVSGLRAEPRSTSYGSVTSSACYRCHRRTIAETTEDVDRGVRMAHEQPLEAGAQCRDCHTATTGVVSSLTSGMTPCLRCHDGEDQPTDCTLCHTKDVGFASRARVNLASMMGRPLIATPDCGGCHDQESQCDPCHGGVRMPHTQVFMSWGHARQGVEDIWFTGGERCGRCHTEERRPCTRCHTFFPGHGIEFRRTHGDSQNPRSCDACHARRAWVNNRDFCELCHVEPAITQ